MNSHLTTAPSAAWRFIKHFWSNHRFWSIIILAGVLWGGYHVYATVTATPTTTRYVTTTAATSTVVATLTETGQVSASQTLTLSPKASGEVVGVYVKPGQQVYAGETIAQLDATDALQALANAKLSLAHEELSYKQTTASSTLALNLLQAQNAVTNAQTALQKTHDTSYASLSSIYTDLSSVVTTLDSALHDKDVSSRSFQENIDAYTDIVNTHDAQIGVFSNSAETAYSAAVTAYNQALTTYKATPRTATNDQLVALADTTYTAAEAVAQAAQDAHDFFDRVNTDYSFYNIGGSDAPTSLLSSVNGAATTVNNDLSTALTVKSNIVSAEQTLAEAQNTLQQAEGGSNTLTVQSAQISLQQAKQAVTTAEQTLADYTVTAPFAGTIASVGVQKYDQASSGTSVATLVTSKQQIDLTVNEVDASKIKVGQKASVTFDALPNVTLAGTVATIDSVGTVSQGVVSYDVTVTLDTQNAMVKPGMSATADIITGNETGLVVPASAIKTAGTESYVEVIPTTTTATSNNTYTNVTPERVVVTTGLTDNTNTVIESGLTAGARVVTQTVSGTSATQSAATSATTRSNFRGGGAGAIFRAGG